MTYSCHVPLVISLESEVGKSDASVYFATYCLLLFFVCFPKEELLKVLRIRLHDNLLLMPTQETLTGIHFHHKKINVFEINEQ